MKKLWDLNKGFSNLELEGHGWDMIMIMPTSARAILHHTDQKGPNILTGSVSLIPIFQGKRNWTHLKVYMLCGQKKAVIVCLRCWKLSVVYRIAAIHIPVLGSLAKVLQFMFWITIVSISCLRWKMHCWDEDISLCSLAEALPATYRLAWSQLLYTKLHI